MTDNWVLNTKTSSEKDAYALEKAKRQEKLKIKNGWSYVKITPRHKILVPCKDGMPTELGLAMIEKYKTLIGV